MALIRDDDWSGLIRECIKGWMWLMDWYSFDWCLDYLANAVLMRECWLIFLHISPQVCIRSTGPWGNQEWRRLCYKSALEDVIVDCVRLNSERAQQLWSGASSLIWHIYKLFACRVGPAISRLDGTHQVVASRANSRDRTDPSRPHEAHLKSHLHIWATER